uniref:Glycosyltransferase n=1 Tax=Antirrhinum majus TaxID=4151 RepID=B1Q469_ANTMA|nr:flavonoid glucoyltransferase UGT73N1 [Antirrhinum majus]
MAFQIQPELLNFVFIPFMAPGHSIPMIDLAKLFAERGVNVTIIVTPLNAARFNSVINRAVESGQSIRLLQVKFPGEEAGLPPGCESAETLPSYELIPNFFTAVKMLQQPIEEELRNLIPLPSCVICDKHIPWTAQTCKNLRIPRIIFDGMSCFAPLVTHVLYVSKVHETVPPNEPFVVPDFPDEIELTRFQLPGLLNPSPRINFYDFREQVKKTEEEAYGVVVNSFEELEKDYFEMFRKLKGGKVWCVGPLSLYGNDDLDRAGRGNKASIDTDRCMKWLDDMKPESVIYACLGSLSRLSRSQFVELALGLEASKHSFVLVVKTEGEKSLEIEKWILDNGFEERTKDRGFLIRGWSPQVLILSHFAVGGFLTHCGWNSTLEGICAGLPMVMWPMFGEQFLNEKLVVQILGTGVGVGAKSTVHLGDEEMDEMRVTRKGITKAVVAVMDRGTEGCERRRKAKELGEMAKRAVQVGGSSCKNVDQLIQEVAPLSVARDV